MKILLIGKDGQVGSELDKQSRILDHNIRSFGRDELDITDYPKVRRTIEIFEPDVVVNASAYHVVSDCEKYPTKAFIVNTIAQKNIAELCEKRKIPVVYYSTSYVFDGKTKTPYKENDRPNPVQLYGLSKYAGEIATLNYNSRAIIIRICGVFGGLGGSRSKKGNFVLYILSQAKKTRRLEISSEQYASFTYTPDLATATLKLLNRKSASGIYHLTNLGFASWAVFAQKIVRLSKLDLKIIPVDRGGTYGAIKPPVFSAIKNTRAKSLKIDMPLWQDALKRYLLFLSDNL